MEQYKTCPKCKQSKDKKFFAKSRNKYDGLQSYCKACQKAIRSQNLERDRLYQISYKAENREVLLAKKRIDGKEYYAKNRERVLARQKANLDPVKHQAKSLLRRSRLQGNQNFQVTRKDLQKMMAQSCFYCQVNQANSVDHVIPVSRGGSHGIGNLVPCCRSCNSSKGTKFITEWKKVRGW
jgi:5-methylcytosine-specific restriction endonuclease McrA